MRTANSNNPANEEILREIYESIVSSYKNTLSPDFSFIGKRYKSGIYMDLISELKGSFELIEHTDLNYSSCLSFCIKSKKLQWEFNLSLVGPYATLCRKGRRRILLSHEKNANTEAEALLLKIISKNKITLLGIDVLRSRIKERLIDNDFGDRVSDVIFNILFFHDINASDLY
ncbi:MAG: hypothetical protein LBE21_07910 [Pseudomonadales bacterium]|jgi:hypothetical protein|nr:hypothetical protein [Pseudomonadales bacterium]